MLSSAFEQAGLTFQDLNPTIPDNLGPTYIANNHYPQIHHLLQSSSASSPSSSSSSSTSPKSSLFWRLRYPFRSLKETNRALFARTQPQITSPPPPSPNFHGVLAVPKPVKFDADDETEYGGGILGNYRRPRLSFPAVYGFQSPEYGLNKVKGKKLTHLPQTPPIRRPSHHPLSPSGHLSSASSLQTPVYFNQNRNNHQQKHQHANQIENILIKPLPSNDLSETTRDSIRKEVSSTISTDSDTDNNKLDNKLTSEKYDDKHDKFKFIRYDYSGFKPMGPASSSQLISSTYPNPINTNDVISASSSSSNGTIDYGKSSNSRDPKYYSFLENNSNNHIDGGGSDNNDDLDDEMSENSMETFSSRLSIFHPEKVEPDNKMILPIAPTDLLRLVSEETRSKGKPIECANKDLGWCDLGDQYPTDFVESIIRRCQRSVDRMYVEVPANLQDYSDYKPFKPVNNGSTDSLYHVSPSTVTTPSTTTTSSSSSVFGNDWSPEKRSPKSSSSDSSCESDKKFIRPIIAQDINGSWYLIAQTNQYHQQIPVQICSSPGSLCNKHGKCSTSSSSLKSRCVQKFFTQLLISIDIDKERECPMMKLYRFPSSCNCQSIS